PFPFISSLTNHSVSSFLTLITDNHSIPIPLLTTVFSLHSRAVLGNLDVLGSTPWWSVWGHDFWGSPLSRRGSHGSWRPLTTLSFRVNAAVARALAPDYGLAGTEGHPAGVPPPSPPLASSSAVPSPAVPSLTPSLNAAFSASTFHAFNVLLHATVTAAYVGVLKGVGVGAWACLGAGSLFAAHPVHVEAVAGVVGRAELLAALAFCLALAAYTRYLRGRATGRAWGRRPSGCGHECVCWTDGQSGRSLPSVLFFWGSKGRGAPHLPSWAWLGLSIAGAGVSMACKEQGVTALGVGLLLHAAAVVCITPRNKAVVTSLVRELWPAGVGAAALLWARINVAPHTPSFTTADNPAAHAPSLLTRALSIARGWAVHGRLLVWPATLSFDWSQGAVPLVTCLSDPANLETAALLACVGVLAATAAAACWRARQQLSTAAKMYTYQSQHAYHDVLNNNVTQHGEAACPACPQRRPPRRPASPLPLVLAWGLLVVPFLPASNLAAYVGFVVAERVLYLPSMGACLLVALGCQSLWRALGCGKCSSSGDSRSKSQGRRGRRWRGVLIGGWVVLLALLSARTVRRNQDWQSDETLYRSGVSLNPPKALSNLGVVYSEQGRLPEAEAAYRAALRHAPSMADTHFNLGLLLASTGRAEEAIESYHAALRSRPWLAQAHLGLAGALQTLGREAEATKVLEACRETGSAPARDGLGHSWAVTTCRQRLARAHLLAGRPHSALQEVARALQHAPQGYGAHSLHTLAAEAHLEAGEHAEAQAALSRALAAHPHHVPAHLTFSRMLQANGSRAEEVEQWLRRAVALAPNDPHAHKHLGQLLLEQDRVEEAVGAWLRAALLDSTDHTAAFNAATALRLAGRNQHAETFYRRAVQLQPKDVASHRNLGAILHLNGKLEEARKHYDEALALAPGDPQTTTNLQRLSALLHKKGLS
ncbi:protein O-mannosyl-transferase TMTC2-like, partial [Eriocheir sinensis]|uniref:protein O-mannosyl-transferase TMTC2-like n=1 Tax=Eriocheir sinensis TaxID=95602 RepID=UPI0021CA8C7B